MSALHKFLDESRPSSAARSARAPLVEPQLVRVVPASSEPASPPSRRSSPQEWQALILRVQAAAKQSRTVEAQARERETRVTQVLERFHADIEAADERVRVSEAQAVEARARADARVKAAEERAQAAEERAQAAEEWLTRVQETILSEFAGLTDHVA